LASPKFETLRYLIENKALNKHLTVESYLLLCILFRQIYDACGGNKCHWCIVAIVERLNRYRGIPQKRNV